ncbi:hypothetical protein CIB48_g8150 [Xylaria polymorpha]|nr:hypothetical protein CIB48_g8150 [Xylaria polymorpha]
MTPLERTRSRSNSGSKGRRTRVHFEIEDATPELYASKWIDFLSLYSGSSSFEVAIAALCSLALFVAVGQGILEGPQLGIVAVLFLASIVHWALMFFFSGPQSAKNDTPSPMGRWHRKTRYFPTSNGGRQFKTGFLRVKQVIRQDEAVLILDPRGAGGTRPALGFSVSQGAKVLRTTLILSDATETSHTPRRSKRLVMQSHVNERAMARKCGQEGTPRRAYLPQISDMQYGAGSDVVTRARAGASPAFMDVMRRSLLSHGRHATSASRGAEARRGRGEPLEETGTMAFSHEPTRQSGPRRLRLTVLAAFQALLFTATYQGRLTGLFNLTLKTSKVAIQGVSYSASLLSNILPGEAKDFTTLLAGGPRRAARRRSSWGQGSSQGAALVHAAVEQLTSSARARVFAAVTYGDTQRLQDGGRIPNFDAG